MDSPTRDGTIVYTLLDVADTSFAQLDSSTPAASRPRRSSDGHKTASPSLLEEIGFDGPQSRGVSFVDEGEADERPSARTNVSLPSSREAAPEVQRRSLPKLPSPGTKRDTKRLLMKPGKFDGTGSLKSFLAQFDVCALHNRWSGADKIDFL